MVRNKWLGKGVALLTGAVLTAGVLTGCGGQDSQVGQGDLSAGAERGAYLEKEQPLTGIPEDVTVKQLLAVDDKVHLVTTKQEDTGTKVQEWELQQDSFVEVTKQWLNELELPSKEWLEITLMQDGNGVQYLFSAYSEAGEEDYRGHLWRSDGEQAKDITPEKWTVQNEEWGIYEIISDITALDNGTLAANSYISSDILQGEDGSVLSEETLSDYYGDTIVTDGENTYLFSVDPSGAINGVEKRAGGKVSAAERLPFDQNKSSASGVMLCVAGDGTLIAAGSDGIFRWEQDAEEWSRLLAGSETGFSLTTCWCVGMTALNDGKIYALFYGEGNATKLFVYEYDPEAVPVVSTVLKLYAVEESFLLQNAAAMYHREHPEVLIELEYGYTYNDKYSNKELDLNEIYQQLNTMLMGEEAPDILVLDHLDSDSFAEKGLLSDINDIIAPMEESGELLSNITGTYVREDGKRYAIPMQFGFTLALGRDIAEENMNSLESLADFLSGQKESYMGTQTAGEMVDMFYPFFCEDIVKESKLDRETLSEKLECLKRIADNCGIVPQRSANEYGYNMWDLASHAKLAFEEGAGFYDSMFPMSMAEYIKGEFTGFENAFIPHVEMGICAKSDYQDIAKDFLSFCLSESVQGTDYYSGFSVNTACLEKLAMADHSEAEACTEIEVGDGATEMFYIKAYPQETAQKLLDICKSLDKPVKEDEKIRETLTECLYEYFAGTQTLEQTVDKIEGGLKMYLAE